MNRALVFGIAIFLAVVGIAMLGGEKTAFAGHGGGGCHCDGPESRMRRIAVSMASRGTDSSAIHSNIVRAQIS